MNFETLNLDVSGPMGRITLNRPGRLNVMNSTMLRELAEAARWFDGQPDVRVVIVSGAGRAFSVGADLKDPSRIDASSSWLTQRAAAKAGSRMMDAIESMGATTVVPPDELYQQTEKLGQEIAALPAVPVALTKEHVNAVSRALASQTSYADGDVLLSAFAFPEGLEARNVYIGRHLGRKKRD